MAEKDYRFMVLPDALDPYGPVGKENLDVIRLQFDFSCYLDPGELISEVMFPTIAPVSTSPAERGWQKDYPPPELDDDDNLPLPPDTYTLVVVSEAVITGTEIDIKLTAGTPGFEYVVTFVAVAATSRRRKQVDTLVYIDIPANPLMAGPGTINPDIVPPIIINGSVSLPMGFDGMLILENSSDLNGIVITLPPNPTLGQEVEFVDSLGKDAAHPVTIRADGDLPIDGDGSLVFVSITAYEALRFVYTGVISNWHITYSRFGFIG